VIRTVHRVKLRVAAIGIILALGPFAALRAQSPALSASAQKLLTTFSKNAKDYIDREHSLAASKLKPTTDVAKLEEQRKQLREAIQQSRPDAKQGDLFTPDVAPVFRKIMAALLNGPEGAKIKTSLAHAEPGAPAQFKVNGEFPNQNGQPIQSIPPSVLKVLPALPKGLEYSIAGRTLALRDTNANMVVDYLTDALP
jgi:hypothetical protein